MQIYTGPVHIQRLCRYLYANILRTLPLSGPLLAKRVSKTRYNLTNDFELKPDGN